MLTCLVPHRDEFSCGRCGALDVQRVLYVRADTNEALTEEGYWDEGLGAPFPLSYCPHCRESDTLRVDGIFAWGARETWVDHSQTD